MITQEELKEILDYNPDTGIFTNRVTRNSRAVKGTNLNPTNEGNYGSVHINKQKYLQHRLAWFYVYGKWPKEQLDHINRIKSDNRISNLRECSPRENSYNTKGQNKTSKYKGVSLDNNKWKAQIRINGIKTTIGRFNTEIEAAKAYDEKAKEFQGDFAVLNFC
jgi:hypothetical protein